MATDKKKPERSPVPVREGVNVRALLPTIGRGIFVVICVCIITGCIVASVMTVYILNSLDSTDRIILENVKLSFTTIFYAEDKATGEYVELQRIQNTENRIWADSADIPQYMKDAAIAVEDKRFLTHSGVDFKRTLLAAINMVIPIYDGMPGGSTITQQLVKNVTKDDDVRVDRKIREILRALNLEKNYSKEQIMEAYLNTIALGNGTNGVQAAANLYFGKDVKDLTLAECAAIISITKNPTYYDPFTHPENNRSRQLMVLDMMLEQGMITQEEHDEAVSQEMVFKKEEYAKTRESVRSWFVDTAYEEVLDDLVNIKGFTRAGAEEQLLSGGYRIYTTVDKEMQDYLEKKYISPDTFPAIINKEYPESAFVILDYNGEIKAIVGSNREKTGARLFNRATDAVRQPGSAIKPLATYGLAIENNYITYSSLWEDAPIELREGDPTSLYPVNYYHSYLGMITISEAIQRSTNTIPVKLVKMMGPRTSFDFLRDKLHFQHLVEQDIRNGKVYSDVALATMALGALTDGVTPLEMAAGYQIFGNGGIYNKPHSYTKVLDSDGNVVLENTPNPQRVLSQETATIVNKLLQQVTRGPHGTGTAAPFSAMPVGGKTGTSEEDENQWFVGITPYYVGVCWLGYDDPQTISYYSYPPPIIWRNVMGPIHANLPIIQFPELGNVVAMTYCTESGDIAGPNCTSTATGWYKTDNIPPTCTLHNSVEGEEGKGENEDGDSSSSSSGSHSSSKADDGWFVPERDGDDD